MKKILLSTTIVAGLLVSTAYADGSVAAAAPVAQQKVVKKHHHKKGPVKKFVKHVAKEVKKDVNEVVDLAKADASKSDAPTVTVGGGFDFQYGTRTQKDNYKKGGSLAGNTSTLTNNVANQMFDSKAKVIVGASGKMNEVEYGAKLVLKTVSNRDTNTADNANRSFLYVQSNFGRVELGSSLAPSMSMSVNAGGIASATGGAVNGDAINYINKPVLQGQSTTPIWLPLTIMNSGGAANEEGPRQVVYYTPKMSGFSLGVSFAPDVDNNATGVLAKNSTLKNYFSAGVKYEMEMNEKNSLAVSAVLDSAKSSDASSHKVRSYEFGAQFAMKPFTVAGSYGHNGKSAVPVALLTDGKSWKSKYWTAGVAVEQDKTTASVTYMNNKMGHDASVLGTSTAQLLSLGVDYKLAPGLMPYAEASWYKFKNTLDNSTNVAAEKLANKGTVFLVGTKVTF